MRPCFTSPPPPARPPQALEELEGRLSRLQLELDAKAKYARASDRERGDQSKCAPPACQAGPASGPSAAPLCSSSLRLAAHACRPVAMPPGPLTHAPPLRGTCRRERAPAAREPSPGGWRRSSPAEGDAAGPAPRGFRDDRPRPAGRQAHRGAAGGLAGSAPVLSDGAASAPCRCGLAVPPNDNRCFSGCAPPWSLPQQPSRPALPARHLQGWL